MLMWVAVCDNRYNQSGKQVRLEKSRVHQREISGEQSKLEQEQEEVQRTRGRGRKKKTERKKRLKKNSEEEEEKEPEETAKDEKEDTYVSATQTTL